MGPRSAGWLAGASGAGARTPARRVSTRPHGRKNMRTSRRTSYLPGAALAAALMLLPAGFAVAAGYQLELQAEPRLTVVEAAAPVAITVKVTDATGAPAADGTEVIFVTTLGAIAPENAATLGGLARAELTSTVPGKAQVSVLVAGQREVVEVEFKGAAASRPAPKPSSMVRIDGRYVAYSAEYDCITATDRARARQGDLVIEAGNIQYQITRGLLKAQHDVRVSSGEANLEGDRLSYSVSSGSGTLLCARERVERIGFHADDLAARAAAQDNADFAPLDTSDTNTWVVARDAIVFPRDRIQFSNATLYVGNKRVLTLPHYVAPLRGQGGLLNQVFSFTSSGGVNLDLPFYYAADSAHVGSLHLRHRARGGYAYGGRGWSLGIEEQYRLSPGSAGKLAVDNLTASTRSLRLDHSLDFGPDARASLGVNYYRYNPSYPAALTGRAFYYHRLPDADLNVIALGSSIGGAANWSLDTNLRWGGMELGRSGIGYDVTANLGYGGGQVGYGGGLGMGAGLGVAPPAWKIGKRTAATLDLAQQYQWAQVGNLRSMFDAQAVLRQGLGGLGVMSLSYNYSLSQGGYYASYGRQRLNLNAYLNRGMLWNASGYASYSLDRDTLFASGGISYHLPIDEKGAELPWRLDLRGSYTHFSTATAVNSRVALGRALGRYEVLLCYSPTSSYGYSTYGYGSGKSFWVELAPLGF